MIIGEFTLYVIPKKTVHIFPGDFNAPQVVVPEKEMELLLEGLYKANLQKVEGNITLFPVNAIATEGKS